MSVPLVADLAGHEEETLEAALRIGGYLEVQRAPRLNWVFPADTGIQIKKAGNKPVSV